MNPNKRSCILLQRLLEDLVKLSVGIGLIYIVFISTSQPNSSDKRRHNTSGLTCIFPQQHTEEFSNNERRIARHFAVDTLPGLMQRGLIKRYERHNTWTMLHVEGKVWKKRSRFFKVSLLTEVLAYNKVNGYALNTRIVDHHSKELYAQALSEDRKEFFN
jgi:hypothetical protein